MSELTHEKIIKIVHYLAHNKWEEKQALDMLTHAVGCDNVNEKQYKEVISRLIPTDQSKLTGSCNQNADASHIDRRLENEGTRNYGSWEIMEIMVKYGDLPGTFMALKHILRKPKNSGTPTKLHGGVDSVRIEDIKKAITYLQREVDMAEGRYKPVIK